MYSNVLEVVCYWSNINYICYNINIFNQIIMQSDGDSVSVECFVQVELDTM